MFTVTPVLDNTTMIIIKPEEDLQLNPTPILKVTTLLISIFLYNSLGNYHTDQVTSNIYLCGARLNQNKFQKLGKIFVAAELMDGSD